MEKIDIHKKKETYEKSLNSFVNNKTIIPQNKKLIIDFLEDCKRGKTLKKRSKKKIECGRLLKLLETLRLFSQWSNKPFLKITQKDFEKVIFDFEDGKHQYTRENIGGNPNTKYNYGDSTKGQYKAIFNKFTNWLRDNHGSKLDNSFVEICEGHKEVEAPTKKDIELMIEGTGNKKFKAYFMVLFDGGARIEELLNVRMSQLSKKDNVYYMRIEHSKTKPRTISLPLCNKLLDDYLGSLSDEDKEPSKQLFPFRYPSANKAIGRISLKVLNKRLSPHRMRDGSATFYANKLNHFQLCKRYGWSMSSTMPSRYIDIAGIDENITIKKVEQDSVSELTEKNEKLEFEMKLIKEQMQRVEDSLVKKAPKMESIIEKLKGFTEEELKVFKSTLNRGLKKEGMTGRLE